MNYIDLIILILILLSGGNGLRKGFIGEVSGLAALVLGIWAAIHFSGFVGGFIAANFDWDSQQTSIVTFIITFVGVVVLVVLIGKVVEKMINVVSLGFLNRLAGLFFGALKGALVLSIFLLIFNFFNKDIHFVPDETIEESQFWSPMMNFVPSILPFIDDFFDVDDKGFDERFDEIRKIVS
ncbi:MAG: CvpA family protein [Prolixibacteraceae bacterium]|nr:CvpA family protein [Prolixibacteraceae bacterium]